MLAPCWVRTVTARLQRLPPIYSESSQFAAQLDEDYVLRPLYGLMVLVLGPG